MKYGINDENSLKLEGQIKGDVRFSTSPNGKGCLNVSIEGAKFINGEKRYFEYEFCVFEPKCFEWKDVLKEGMFVKISGHLMSNTIAIGEGENTKLVRTHKPVADFIEVELN
jgi:hypothetical protein